MPNANDRLNDVLKDAFVSKTIYAYAMPESQQVLDAVLDDDRAAYHDMFTEAWTQKQDEVHEEFFDTWSAWSRPVVALDRDEFKHVYPTAGASEAIRATIQGYGCDARAGNFGPAVHVFEGEYEGYAAIADASRIPLKTHPRDRWREAIAQIGPHDQFYISQPSAIDGNVWGEFEDFAAALEKAQPTAQLMLDVTYVGAVAKPFAINANHPNIAKVFLSLSKPFGTYYHRIGGCFAREEDKSLFGNRWFKNVQSLKFGTELMKHFGVHDLPSRYAPVQVQAMCEASKKLGTDLSLCDVFLLAGAKLPAQPTELQNYLRRDNGANPLIRVCLTPTMARIGNPSLNHAVTARAHETLPPSPPGAAS